MQCEKWHTHAHTYIYIYKNSSATPSRSWHTHSTTLTLSDGTMSLRAPFSNMGVQFSHDFNNRYYQNIEYCVRASIATHSYPAFTGQLLSANSYGGSSLTWTIVSIGILPTPLGCSLSLLVNWLLQFPPDCSLPRLDKETLSLLINIPFLF